MAHNEFDFGFTFEDTEPQPALTASDTQFQADLLNKITSLEKKLNNQDVNTLVEEHKQLLHIEAKGKLREVENLILPLLYNLQKNPTKEYIHWPNRKDIIQTQIDKILEVTKHYG